MNTLMTLRRNGILVWLAFLLAVPQVMAAERLTPYQQKQKDADAAFSLGDYKTAYSKYAQLARQGDKFSQYRLSYMNFQGQGVEADMAEAFAWAVLAAEGENPELIKYLGALAREVPVADEKRATLKAKQYLDRWGDLAIAEAARKNAISEIRGCTGSRLGARCEEVHTMQMPRFWTIQGKGLWKDPSNPIIGSASYSTGNGTGGEVLNTRYYQALRWGTVDIDDYIESHVGVVRIGDLSTIDDTASE